MSESDTGRLFEEPEPAADDRRARAAPLAERMRPREPEEIVGQDHLLGSGKLLRRMLESGEPTSMILWGPPGVGKTTLARLLARGSGVAFVELSATSSGVRQLRETAEAAARRLRHDGTRTILFVDEIHRFHKGQQDALLPWVEDGSVILVGATTENPSFEVVPPLLSRCRVVRLEPLAAGDIEGLLRRALRTPPPRGLSGAAEVGDAEIERIAALADGDARVALSTLELAVEIVTREAAREDASPRVTSDVVKEALQRPTLRYDKAGEEHYNEISALHKSVRNSDPDAALYWLARMLEAGEEPRYIARRLIRMASEDIGLADPAALSQAVAGLDAVHTIGLPEGALALAQVAVYLATAPKSDALYRAFGEARRAARDRGNLPVPLHLRNPVTDLMRQEGYGRGYRHAHRHEEGVTSMQCLPDALADERFYRPTERGHEAELGRRIREWSRARERRPQRSAQEPEPDSGEGPDPAED